MLYGNFLYNSLISILYGFVCPYDCPPPPKKLLDVVREAIRLKHYSYRTEQTYIDWIERYLRFHNKRSPREMGVPEIQAVDPRAKSRVHHADRTRKRSLIKFLEQYGRRLSLGLHPSVI